MRVQWTILPLVLLMLNTSHLVMCNRYLVLTMGCTNYGVLTVPSNIISIITSERKTIASNCCKKTPIINRQSLSPFRLAVSVSALEISAFTMPVIKMPTIGISHPKMPAKRRPYKQYSHYALFVVLPCLVNWLSSTAASV